jgi:hypothetical protein
VNKPRKTPTPKAVAAEAKTEICTACTIDKFHPMHCFLCSKHHQDLPGGGCPEWEGLSARLARDPNPLAGLCSVCATQPELNWCASGRMWMHKRRTGYFCSACGHRRTEPNLDCQTHVLVCKKCWDELGKIEPRPCLRHDKHQICLRCGTDRHANDPCQVCLAVQKRNLKETEKRTSP